MCVYARGFSTFILFVLLRTYLDTSHSPGEESVPSIPSGRMRKRDIVRYYGHRMIRKAGMELGHLKRRPKEKVFSIAKR